MRFREQQKFRAAVGLETRQAEEGRFEHFEAGAGGGGDGEGGGGEGAGYCVHAGRGGVSWGFERGRKGEGERGSIPVKGAGEDEVVVHGEFVETFMEVALVD